MTPTFGDVRAAVHRRPSPRAWHDLCCLLDGFEDDDEVLHRQIVPYCQQHLAGWPATLRPCPIRWLDRRVVGELVPQLTLVGLISLQHDESIPRLAEVARCDLLDSLDTLQVFNVGLKPSDLSALVRQPWFGALSRFDLQWREWGAAEPDLPALPPRLPAPRLRVLGLRLLGGFARRARELRDALVAEPHLQELRLGGAAAPDDVGGWTDLLARAPGLRALRLVGTSVSREQLRSLLEALAQQGVAPELDTLRLGGCALEPGELARFLRARPAASLRGLDLSYTQGLGDEDLEALAHAASTSALTWLSLASARGPQVSWAGISALFYGPAMAGVRHLDLTYFPTTVEEPHDPQDNFTRRLSQLGDAPLLAGLEQLEMGGGDINRSAIGWSEVIAAWGRAGVFDELRRLWAAVARWGDRRAALLTLAQEAPPLERLGLFALETLDAELLRRLFEQGLVHGGVRRLDLSGCQALGVRAVEVFLDHPEAIAGLEVLDVSGTALSDNDEAVQRMQRAEALAGCLVLSRAGDPWHAALQDGPFE